MNTDKIKELLSAKIDSKEKWDETMTAIRYNTPHDDAARALQYRVVSATTSAREAVQYDRQGHRALLGANPPTPVTWWYERERARLAAGIYPELSPTMAAVLDAVGRGYSPIAYQNAHPSTEDPRRVARTMSAEDGARDRQLVTSVDKWLRSVFPLEPDHSIQRMAQQHISEVDPTLLIATTEADVQSIYQNGPNACMSHSPATYGLPDHLHPSHVYAHNGFGVAYMGTVERASARAVVWVNPDDANDKRFVRVYPGASALERKLLANGFEKKNFAGAKLKAIRHDDRVIVPYMDSDGSTSGLVGAIYEGDEDNVRLLTSATASRLGKIGRNYIVGLQTTSVLRTFTVVPDSVANLRCCLTGERIEDGTATSPVLKSDGTVGIAKESEVINGGWVTVATTGQHVWANIAHEGTLWVTVGSTLRITVQKRDHDLAYGTLRALDPTYYPAGTLTYSDTHTTLAGTHIREGDAVKLLVVDPEQGVRVSYAHKDDPRVKAAQASTRKNITSEFVTITPDAGRKVLVAKDAMEHIGTTPSGRRVTVWTHDVKRVGNGMEYSRNLEPMYFPGSTLQVRRSDMKSPWEVTREQARGYLDSVKPNRLNDEGMGRWLDNVQNNRPSLWLTNYVYTTNRDGRTRCVPLASSDEAVGEYLRTFIGTPLPEDHNNRLAWAAAHFRVWVKEWVDEQRAALTAAAETAEFEDIPY